MLPSDAHLLHSRILSYVNASELGYYERCIHKQIYLNYIFVLYREQ
jgi:hypothetical protein